VMTGLPTRQHQAGNTGHPVPGPIRPAATAALRLGACPPERARVRGVHHIQGRSLINPADRLRNSAG
jgi:hypothetical protein